MPRPPPRLVPTVLLAALWVALYLLYLSVKPEPPAPGRDGRVTTTTSVTSPGGGGELSLAAVRTRVPGWAG